MDNKYFELWRPVVGYEGLYEVSNCGNVRSLNFGGKKGKIQNLRQGNILGYRSVVLVSADGHKATRFVHRLVVQSFIQENINGREINHINENRSDNRLCNLTICTHRQNIIFGTSVQRMAAEHCKGVHQKDATTGEILASYRSIQDAAKMNGIHATGISAVCRGKTKTSGGFAWEFSGVKAKKPLKLYEQFGEQPER